MQEEEKKKMQCLCDVLIALCALLAGERAINAKARAARLRLFDILCSVVPLLM